MRNDFKGIRYDILKNIFFSIVHFLTNSYKCRIYLHNC